VKVSAKKSAHAVLPPVPPRAAHPRHRLPQVALAHPVKNPRTVQEILADVLKRFPKTMARLAR
jgi:hypothetical protein